MGLAGIKKKGEIDDKLMLNLNVNVLIHGNRHKLKINIICKSTVYYFTLAPHLTPKTYYGRSNLVVPAGKHCL